MSTSDSTVTQYGELRREMVEQIARHAQLVGHETGKAVLSEKVMDVMLSVPRHEFVPVELRAFAYTDSPLPIGYDKTISQPFIVALMTDLLDLQAEDRILEVGTGLGYQASILAKLVERVYSMEILDELADGASRRLTEQGAVNVEVRVGDGSKGWPEHAPFDKILVAAAPDLIPTSLLSQLKPGGKMVIPAGIENAQQLMLVEKNEKGQLSVEEILPVRFSSLTLSH
ncbi:MAG: protein-L-isoaspartate(D-aspartate) O-methyltransferase [Gammaproteobacteria bacterium]|jgi:protein-L-isoaspartate(D-aspartate) O-methyltransferase|nr:protein-L-isoaspartate(D-aspartate) O-methyltransferase [Gammaproteobacteria bacterium]MDX2461067.1 protein-L-isoaspartate(D-aspartate) O-methyltransferase [Gammaproteobacteria bacterium]